MDERHRIDPEGKYDFRVPSRVKLVAYQLPEILPRPGSERTRDVVHLEVQSEPEVNHLFKVEGARLNFTIWRLDAWRG